MDAFLKEIENERRREFAGEGLRWMDMRRFGSMKAHLGSKGVDIRRVHFPVYSGERVNNQNFIKLLIINSFRYCMKIFSF